VVTVHSVYVRLGRVGDLMGRRLCVFCQQPNKSSGEHLFAEWTGQLINAEDMNHQFAVDKNEPKRWKTAGITHTVTGPCKPCNETWMSDIETVVTPVLGPMILHSAATALDRNSQARLAAWATKTAMVAEFMRPAECTAAILLGRRT